MSSNDEINTNEFDVEIRDTIDANMRDHLEKMRQEEIAAIEEAKRQLDSDVEVLKDLVHNYRAKMGIKMKGIVTELELERERIHDIDSELEFKRKLNSLQFLPGPCDFISKLFIEYKIKLNLPGLPKI
jgi:hypothetical protein